MNKSVSIHNVIPLAVIALLCICLVISASSLATATTLDSNNEVGGKVVCSERYMKIQMAEKAIKDKYRITPEMYTFFTREVTSSGNSITVTLTGANKFIMYWEYILQHQMALHQMQLGVTMEWKHMAGLMHLRGKRFN